MTGFGPRTVWFHRAFRGLTGGELKHSHYVGHVLRMPGFEALMAAALINRLLHHCHIVNIRGNSYRMRAHQDLLRANPRDEDGIRGDAA